MKTYKSQINKLSLLRENCNLKKVKITSSDDAQEYFRNFYKDDIDIFESFFIILLNNANTTIGWVKISQGGLASTVVDARIILKYAIDTLATSVICCHNHPSGNLKPSNADINLTNKISKALKLVDVTLLDHIILSNESYYSFADNGIL